MMKVSQLIHSSNSVKEFTLNGRILLGKVVDCYDADTCRINFIFNNKLTKFNCRLYGIDSPEIKPLKKKLDRDIEIKNAIIAKNSLINFILRENKLEKEKNYKKKEIEKILEENNNLIKVKCGKFDKYGRLLVELYPYQDYEKTKQNGGAIIFENSYNKYLINNGFAYEYYGGTKK
jgi:endonuclease YncB( thermonuclease family)